MSHQVTCSCHAHCTSRPWTQFSGTRELARGPEPVSHPPVVAGTLPLLKKQARATHEEPRRHVSSRPWRRAPGRPPEAAPHPASAVADPRICHHPPGSPGEVRPHLRSTTSRLSSPVIPPLDGRHRLHHLQLPRAARMVSGRSRHSLLLSSPSKLDVSARSGGRGELSRDAGLGEGPLSRELSRPPHRPVAAARTTRRRERHTPP